MHKHSRNVTRKQALGVEQSVTLVVKASLIQACQAAAVNNSSVKCVRTEALLESLNSQLARKSVASQPGCVHSAQLLHLSTTLVEQQRCGEGRQRCAVSVRGT